MKYLMAAFYIGFLLSFFTTKYSVPVSAQNAVVMAEDAAHRFQSSHIYRKAEYYLAELSHAVSNEG
ncbi:MAG: hypothetical protein SFX19_04345 [Alphaproteobacteria bacterium]|nr:hypothetical protein [Alphaproteobacteria bacterium]